MTGVRRVGLIGLGAMGLPMARRLLAAGYELAVWARRPESATEAVAAGAVFCKNPAQLAARSEITLSIVTQDADVEGLVAGPEGLAAGWRRGGVHVDCSTISPETARRVAERARGLGVGFLDAPVSGGPMGAAAGSLAIMVGGEAEVLAAAGPVLSALGQRIVHVGPSGAGQVAKACNQMVMVAGLQAVAEALALANAAGVPLEAGCQALAGGSAGSRVLDTFGPRMRAHRYENGVESRLHAKDFGIIQRAVHGLDLGLPLMSLMTQRLAALQASGAAKDDTACLFRQLLAERSCAPAAATGEKV